jgi:hypothetical protein
MTAADIRRDLAIHWDGIVRRPTTIVWLCRSEQRQSGISSDNRP